MVELCELSTAHSISPSKLIATNRFVSTEAGGLPLSFDEALMVQNRFAAESLRCFP